MMFERLSGGVVESRNKAKNQYEHANNDQHNNHPSKSCASPSVKVFISLDYIKLDLSPIFSIVCFNINGFRDILVESIDERINH
jgi:hypothetical protein